MTRRNQPRIVVAVNRDHEATADDPENRSRADIVNVAEDVRAALVRKEFAVEVVGVTDDVTPALEQISAYRPDAVFNLCESLRSQGRFEAVLPLLLDLRGIAYTGSEPLTLLLTMDKTRCKEILRAHGVSTPSAVCITGTEAPDLPLRFPVIVKPSREDASVGITLDSVVHDRRAALDRAYEVIERYRQPALIEEFIEGREVYVSKLDDPTGSMRLFPFFEIDFSTVPSGRPHIVSYRGKWDEESEDFRTTPSGPARDVPQVLAARIEVTARAAFAALGVRDYGRVDLRVAADGTPFVIELNPNCDLSAHGGGFAKAARAAGLSYDDLVGRIVNLAVERHGAAA